MTPAQIKKLRPEGMTAREWAGMLGVHESTVSLWESGQRKPRPAMITLMKIFSKKIK